MCHISYLADHIVLCVHRTKNKHSHMISVIASKMLNHSDAQTELLVLCIFYTIYRIMQPEKMHRYAFG